VEDDLQTATRAGSRLSAHQWESMSVDSDRVETFKGLFEDKLETGKCGVLILENLKNPAEVVLANYGPQVS
jgi:hypothetical protein